MTDSYTEIEINPAQIYGTREFNAARARRMAERYTPRPRSNVEHDEPVPFQGLREAGEHYRAIRERLFPAQAKPERVFVIYQTDFGPFKPLPLPIPKYVLYAEEFGPGRRDWIEVSTTAKILVEDIIRTVSRHYMVSREDILSIRRQAIVVRPRQVAMYLAKTLSSRSLPDIGRRFGGRDHTTVLHAVKKISALLETDTDLAANVLALTRKLQGVAQ